MANKINDISGFITLTGSTSFTFVAVEGWTKAALLVDDNSTGDCVISSTDTDKIGGRNQGSVALKAGKSITLGTGKKALSNITLTVQTGCIVYLAVAKDEYIIAGYNV